MSTKHWTEEELIDRLYGIEPSSAGSHICPECEARWQALLERRAAFLQIADPAVPATVLARQRREVRERLSSWPAVFSPLRQAVAAGALAGVVCLAILLNPAPPSPEPMVATAANDRALYEDVFQTLASPVPAAVAPINGLFEYEEQEVRQ